MATDEREVSLGIDIGGTFTDIVCVTNDGPKIFKVPSTRSNPSIAVRNAIAQLKDEHGVAPDSITRFAHGTTVATNAVLERKGARIGIIATRGFKDVLEIGRQMRREMYDLKLRSQTPAWLAPGARRVEVDERVSADGSVVTALSMDSVRLAVDELLEQKVEAIAVTLLFSFLNPAHERAIAAYIAEVAPDLPVSLSSEVDPAFREYERTVVTAFDSYVKPVVDRYLREMEESLAASGMPAPLQIMQSRGGLAISSVARLRPVRLFLSGPAGGVIGGLSESAQAGIDKIITIDVGGTSSDIALVDGGEALVRSETSIAGYSVRVPMVDIETLGAGGGSLVWLDSAKGMRVGPESAGAEPGPVCYGRGGTQPTVTDASIVLGYLDPGYFAGGTLRLDPALAEDAIRKEVAEPMGFSVPEAALGIHRIANAQMAEGIRLVSLNRGLDPREFVLVPLGGAGALHAVPLAEELGIRRVLVPRYPGVLSAAGLLAAPIEHEVAAAYPMPLNDAITDDLAEFLSTLDAQAGDLMAAENLSGLKVETRYSADVCYMGQSSTLEVVLDLSGADPIKALYTRFEETHRRIFGHATGAPAKIVNLRTVHRAQLAPPNLTARVNGAAKQAHKGSRLAWFEGLSSAVETAVYDRDGLTSGERFEGPAIVEQSDTTTLVPPGWQALVVEGSSLLIERKE